MSRKQIFHSVFLLILLVGWAWLEQSSKGTNWEQTFYSSHKIPHGTFVLRDNIQSIFPESEIEDNYNSFYELMNGADSACSGICIIIIAKKVMPDSLEYSKMEEFMAKGNTIFISAQNMSGELLSKNEIKLEYIKSRMKKQSSKLSFSPKVKKSVLEYEFVNLMPNKCFKFSDSTVVNKVVRGKENGFPCFVEIQKEKGKLFLHTQPLAFTNYHLLYNHSEYASVALSHISAQKEKIYWDNYYNPYAVGNSSPLKIVLAKPALRSALYLLLIFLLVYILFMAKRKQRIIQVVNRPENLSLGFIETIGRLYFHKGNHRDIAEKEFVQFKYFLRKKYLINRMDFNSAFVEKLSFKSGVQKEIISDLFKYYDKMKNKETISEQELHIFTNQIHRFHNNIKRK